MMHIKNSAKDKTLEKEVKISSTVLVNTDEGKMVSKELLGRGIGMGEHVEKTNVFKKRK